MALDSLGRTRRRGVSAERSDPDSSLAHCARGLIRSRNDLQLRDTDHRADSDSDASAR